MDAKTFTRITKLFVDKGWIREQFYTTPLENLCELIINLKPNERDLLLELTERYNWLSNDKYFKLITETWNKIDEAKLANCHTIYLFPIKKPTDKDTIKSGDSLVYQVQASTLMSNRLSRIKFKSFSNFEKFATTNFELNSMILLVDDFLGSGKTFTKCLQQIIEVNPSIRDKLNIFAIAIHQDALKVIAESKIPVYYGHAEKRGISDYHSGSDAESRIGTMLNIEKRLKINLTYSLGFGKTEALITLIRTPNNTFPIFWDEYEIDGVKKSAPFPRY